MHPLQYTSRPPASAWLEALVAAAGANAAAMGLQPLHLALAFCGAVIGLTVAPAGRTWMHDMLLFVSVVAGGAYVGPEFGPAAQLVAAQVGFAFVRPDLVAVFGFTCAFHPSFNLLVAALRRRAAVARGPEAKDDR